MNEQEFKDRTKKLALRIIRLIEALPKNQTGEIIGRQLLRSGMSVGANYRAACRGKSSADVINKLSIVEEEADETAFWLELIIDSGIRTETQIRPLLGEAGELVAILASSRKSAVANRKSAIR